MCVCMFVCWVSIYVLVVEVVVVIAISLEPGHSGISVYLLTLIVHIYVSSNHDKGFLELVEIFRQIFLTSRYRSSANSSYNSQEEARSNPNLESKLSQQSYLLLLHEDYTCELEVFSPDTYCKDGTGEGGDDDGHVIDEGVAVDSACVAIEGREVQVRPGPPRCLLQAVDPSKDHGIKAVLDPTWNSLLLGT